MDTLQKSSKSHEKSLVFTSQYVVKVLLHLVVKVQVRCRSNTLITQKDTETERTPGKLTRGFDRYA